MSTRSSQWWNKFLPLGQDTPPGPGQTFNFRKNEERKKMFVLQTGNTLNSHKDVIDCLKKQVRLQQVSTVDECDFILVFCPVVSRAGTDIEAALKKLKHQSDTKPAVLVVLHHTFDPECVVPDSSRAVHRTNMVTVDCLFHEDKGLLQCHKNNESLFTALHYINPQGKRQGQESACTDKRITEDNSQGHYDQSSQAVDPVMVERMTDKAEEGDNAQHKGDQQLQSNYEQLQKEEQTLVENMEMGLEKKQTEFNMEKEQLKKIKNHFKMSKEVIYEKDAEIAKMNEKFNNAVQQKNTEMDNMNKLLSEKDTQLKDRDKKLETSNNKLETLGQELQDKKRHLQKMMIVVEQQKTEFAKNNKELQEKDNQLAENAQALQVKDAALEENETRVKQFQSKFDKTLKELEESQRRMEEKNAQLENMNKLLSEKETQLKNTDKELETSNNKLETLGQELQDKKRQLQEMMIVLEQQKTELAEKNKQLEEKERLLTERETQLMERDKQLQEKDKRLTENTHALEQKGIQIKQEEGDEKGALTGLGKSNVTADELKLENKSQNKDQHTGDIKRHTENTNEVENNEKTDALLKDGITELQNIAKKPHGGQGASHETEEQSKLD